MTQTDPSVARFFITVSQECLVAPHGGAQVIPIAEPPKFEADWIRLLATVRSISGSPQAENVALGENMWGLVRSRWEEVKSALSDSNQYSILPGRHVGLSGLYPEGGNNTAVIVAHNDPAIATATVTKFCTELGTKGLAVISSDNYKENARGFRAVFSKPHTELTLHEAARMLQLQVDQYFFEHAGMREKNEVSAVPKSEIHIPCWIYETKRGYAVQAVADPQTVANLQQWREGIAEISTNMGKVFPIIERSDFKDVAYIQVPTPVVR